MNHRRPNLLVIAAASVTLMFLTLPLIGLVAKAPWSELTSELTRPETASALRLSLFCSSMAAIFAALLGAPLAWLLGRTRFPGHDLVRAVSLAPLILPPVVGGVGLLLVLGRRAFLGRWLFDAFGIQLPFSTAGAIVAETFVALPFFILAAESAFAATSTRMDEAAAVLGAGRMRTFLTITIPVAMPGLRAGLLLAWARALGEFGATITFAGNTPFKTTTIPLQVFVLFESGLFKPAIALSLVLLAISIIVLVALRDRWIPAT